MAQEKGGGIEEEAARIEGTDGGKETDGRIGKRGFYDRACGVGQDPGSYCEKEAGVL
jgi:hypothetical protein